MMRSGLGTNRIKIISMQKHKHGGIHTNSFTDEQVGKALILIQNLGVKNVYRTWQTRRATGNKEPVIQLKESTSVKTFMNLIEPHICESFKYKIKRPKYG